MCIVRYQSYRKIDAGIGHLIQNILQPPLKANINLFHDSMILVQESSEPQNIPKHEMYEIEPFFLENI